VWKRPRGGGGERYGTYGATRKKKDSDNARVPRVLTERATYGPLCPKSLPQALF